MTIRIKLKGPTMHKGIFGIVFLGWLALYVGVAAVLGIFIDWTVSYWLAYAGKPDDFTYLHGFLVALLVPCVGQVAFVAAVATFVLSFFL